jgi:hypothetical protein
VNELGGCSMNYLVCFVVSETSNLYLYPFCEYFIHPQPSSSTTILSHHPQPSSSTIVLNHHPQPPSSTIVLNHHREPPSFDQVFFNILNISTRVGKILQVL